MADPISIVALGAAVGGVAGKLAEKTWDSADGWLRDRFMHHGTKAKEAARQNTANFLVELANRVRALEDQRAINQSTAEAQEGHPHFALVLQLAVMAGSQTDCREKHEILADLVAARLASNSDTTVALAAEMACQVVARATSRQLRLLGLCSFLQDVRPKHSIPPSDQKRWLESLLEPFDEVSFEEIDAQHLVAIGCATFDPASERSLKLLLQIKLGGPYDCDLPESVDLEMLQIRWDLGLSGLQLTSVGRLLGGFVFDHMVGANIGVPSWD